MSTKRPKRTLTPEEAAKISFDAMPDGAQLDVDRAAWTEECEHMRVNLYLAGHLLAKDRETF